MKKLKKLEKMIDNTNQQVRLEVDGGINLNNISEVAKCGADTFVAGSSIFKSDNYKDTISRMRSLLTKNIIKLNDIF